MVAVVVILIIVSVIVAAVLIARKVTWRETKAAIGELNTFLWVCMMLAICNICTPQTVINISHQYTEPSTWSPSGPFSFVFHL